MEQHTIEIFMPLETADEIKTVAEHFASIPSLAHIWLWTATPYEGEAPSGTTLLNVDSLTDTTLFRDMAERASADFVLYVAKPNVNVDVATLEKLIELMSINPRKRFGLPETDDFCVFDLEKSYIIDPNDFLSKGKSTPFAGETVFGECELTVCGGKAVWIK